MKHPSAFLTILIIGLLAVISAKAEDAPQNETERVKEAAVEEEQQAPAKEEQKKTVVAISDFKPFAFKGEDGKYTGFDIDFWDAVAEEMGMNKEEYAYQPVPFKQIFENLKEKKADVGISSITINEEREKSLDFSHHYFDSGLNIVVEGHAKAQSIIPLIAKRLFTFEMAKLLGMLFLTILFWGLLLWLAEKGADVIKDAFKQGFPDAVWCVWAQITTIGFGDIYPKKLLGRLLSIPIFLTGCVIVGVVSAPVISAFTVRDMEHIESKINKPGDLLGKTVATQSGTTSIQTLDDLGAKVLATPTIEKAYAELLNKNVDAVVFDAPTNIYYAQNEGKGQVMVVGNAFDLQYYGIALQQDSELREPINRAILKLQTNGVYDRIYKKWFGEKK